MGKLRPPAVNVLEWLAILPKIAALVNEVVVALKDGQLTREEVERIGADFVAIVASVA